MNACKDCKFWVPPGEAAKYPYDHDSGPLGMCSRWRKEVSGAFDKSSVPKNEVVVEYDESWGAMMGPDFGCVLWEKS